MVSREFTEDSIYLKPVDTLILRDQQEETGMETAVRYVNGYSKDNTIINEADAE